MYMLVCFPSQDYIFSSGSLQIFTCYCYWEGEHSNYMYIFTDRPMKGNTLLCFWGLDRCDAYFGSARGCCHSFFSFGTLNFQSQWQTFAWGKTTVLYTYRFLFAISGFLLLIVIYGFSIVCRNVMGNLTNSDFEGTKRQGRESTHHNAASLLADTINNEMHFGTLPRTMLTSDTLSPPVSIFRFWLNFGWVS